MKSPAASPRRLYVEKNPIESVAQLHPARRQTTSAKADS
jgi:hypothetical protein